MPKAKKARINIWKWAFIILVSVLLVFLVAWNKPVNKAEPIHASIRQENSMRPDAYEGRLSFTTEELQELVNDFLSSQENAANLQVTIQDHIKANGSLDVWGQQVPYSFSLRPNLHDNGNLVLHVEDLRLLSISLPISVVMDILSDRLELPEWVQVDSQSQEIYLALDQVKINDLCRIQMTSFDLMSGQVELELKVDRSALQERMRS